MIKTIPNIIIIDLEKVDKPEGGDPSFYETKEKDKIIYLILIKVVKCKWGNHCEWIIKIPHTGDTESLDQCG